MSTPGADSPTPMLVDAKSLTMDIHDALRDKIIIRPRCKEYVKKQRDSGPTLACFTALALDQTASEVPGVFSDNPTTEKKKKDTLLAPSERSERLARYFKLGSKTATGGVRSGRIEKSPTKSPRADILTQSRLNHPPAPDAPNKLHSGCVEITATATPVNILTAAADVVPHQLTFAALPSAQYSCTCRDPKSCPRCRLLALADRFCTIVAKREQQLRMTH